MNSPLVISVAPNGSSKTKKDHPNLPISPEELALEAKNSQKAGATLIHLHVRNQQGKHTLDTKHYKDAISAIKEAVNDEIIVQVTSEATGICSPAQQMDMIGELKPEAVSIAIKELIPDEAHEQEAAWFLKWMLDEKISPQYVVYSDLDLQRFYELKAKGVIPGRKNFVLFVLGRYSSNQESSPEDLLAFVNANKKYNTDKSVNWAVCAFGKSEASCMLTSAMLGGHVRIGFENNLHLMDGTLASSNAELLQQFCGLYPAVKRRIANIKEARELVLC